MPVLDQCQLLPDSFPSAWQVRKNVLLQKTPERLVCGPVATANGGAIMGFAPGDVETVYTLSTSRYGTRQLTKQRTKLEDGRRFVVFHATELNQDGFVEGNQARMKMTFARWTVQILASNPELVSDDNPVLRQQLQALELTRKDYWSLSERCSQACRDDSLKLARLQEVMHIGADVPAGGADLDTTCGVHYQIARLCQYLRI